MSEREMLLNEGLSEDEYNEACNMKPLPADVACDDNGQRAEEPTPPTTGGVAHASHERVFRKPINILPPNVRPGRKRQIHDLKNQLQVMTIERDELKMTIDKMPPSPKTPEAASQCFIDKCILDGRGPEEVINGVCRDADAMAEAAFKRGVEAGKLKEKQNIANTLVAFGKMIGVLN